VQDEENEKRFQWQRLTFLKRKGARSVRAPKRRGRNIPNHREKERRRGIKENSPRTSPNYAARKRMSANDRMANRRWKKMSMGKEDKSS